MEKRPLASQAVASQAVVTTRVRIPWKEKDIEREREREAKKLAINDWTHFVETATYKAQ